MPRDAGRHRSGCGDHASVGHPASQFPVESEADCPAEIRIASQNGVGEIEADIVGLEVGRGNQADAAAPQCRGKLHVLIDHRFKILLSERAVVEFALQEHQPGGQRLFHQIAGDRVKKRQRPGPVGGGFRGCIQFFPVIRVALHFNDEILSPARNGERAASGRMIRELIAVVFHGSPRNR